jgi:hypothetical protein
MVMEELQTTDPPVSDFVAGIWVGIGIGLAVISILK